MALDRAGKEKKAGKFGFAWLGARVCTPESSSDS
jgi:hypothetical protein